MKQPQVLEEAIRETQETISKIDGLIPEVVEAYKKLDEELVSNDYEAAKITVYKARREISRTLPTNYAIAPLLPDQTTSNLELLALASEDLKEREEVLSGVGVLRDAFIEDDDAQPVESYDLLYFVEFRNMGKAQMEKTLEDSGLFLPSIRLLAALKPQEDNSDLFAFRSYVSGTQIEGGNWKTNDTSRTVTFTDYEPTRKEGIKNSTHAPTEVGSLYNISLDSVDSEGAVFNTTFGIKIEIFDKNIESPKTAYPMAILNGFANYYGGAGKSIGLLDDSSTVNFFGATTDVERVKQYLEGRMPANNELQSKLQTAAKREQE